MLNSLQRGSSLI